MPSTPLNKRSWTLALVYTLLLFISSYPQPVLLPSTTIKISAKKLFDKKISMPAVLAEWVFASGLFSLPIMQQPVDNPVYVANKPDVLTQFQQATQNGVIGLLAHNYLLGNEFSKLMIGQQVSITYTDHVVRDFRVASIYRYQKLDPSDLFSDLVDLHTGKELSTKEVFNRFYRGRPHVTFQTCLEADGRLDWGLLFVIALPVDHDNSRIKNPLAQ